MFEPPFIEPKDSYCNTTIFINLTNHPSAQWSKKQKEAALELAPIIKDVGFPNVPATASEEIVAKGARKLVHDLIDYVKHRQSKAIVLCQGEMTFTYAVVKRLKEEGIAVVAACSERKVKEEQMEDGTTKKTAVFDFVQFRRY